MSVYHYFACRGVAEGDHVDAGGGGDEGLLARVGGLVDEGAAEEIV